MIGSKTVNHKDIAQLVHVTQPTVSRALDPARSHLVAEATRKKIEAAAARLGFSSNIHARRTRTHSSEALTLVVDHLGGGRSALFGDFNLHTQRITFDVISGVIDGAAEMNFEVKLLPMHSRREPDADFLRTHLRFPYSDGVIYNGFTMAHPLSSLLGDAAVPQLMIANAQVPDAVCPMITAPPLRGVAAAAEALAAGGYEQVICHLFDRTCGEMYYQNERFDAWRTVLKRCLPDLPIAIFEGADKYAVRQYAAALVATERRRSAIVALNDGAAMLWAEEFERLGCPSPERFGVVGYDGNGAFPELASVTIPYYELGETAAQMLVRSLREGVRLENRQLTTSFRKGSTL